MTSTNFVDKTTVIEAPWLNDVDADVYGVNGEPRISDQAFDAVASYGMSTSNTGAQNTTALTAALTAALAVNGKVVIQAGTYKMTAGTNWAALATFRVNGIRIEGLGQVILDYSLGSGSAFVLDCSGLAPAYMPGFEINNLMILGGPSITYGWFQSGIIRSSFKRLRVKECSMAGFELRFSVLNHYDTCVVSDDLGVQTTKPGYYFHVTQGSGFHSSANVFTNCEAGGVGGASTATGWMLDFCSIGVWNGCTAESFSRGIYIGGSSVMNQFNGMDYEANTLYDLELNGNLNTFVGNTNNPSPGATYTIAVENCASNTFVGGKIRSVNLAATSSATTFVGVMFTTGLGISGTGTYACYGCSEGTDYVWERSLPDRFIGAMQSSTTIYGNPFFDIYGNTNPAVGPPSYSTVPSGASAILETSIVYPGNPRSTSVKLVSLGTDVHNGLNITPSINPWLSTGPVSITIPVYAINATGYAIVHVYDGTTYTELGMSTATNTWELITGTVTLTAGVTWAILVSTIDSSRSAYTTGKTVYIGGLNVLKGPNPSQTIDNSIARQTSIIIHANVPAYAPAFIGQRYYRTTSGVFYTAVGATSSADWIAM